jgi:hypothetical protein
MEKELTPSESLALITQVITEAKTRFRDNGFSFIFLGICCFAASLGQFILLQLQYYNINYIPYFIMPFAAMVTYYYYKKKTQESKARNIISSALGFLGIFLGINFMISGFFFWNKFGIALIPFMLILFSVWIVMTGTLIRNKVFIYAGIITNLISYVAFFVDIKYHPLLLSAVSLIGVVLPGIVLNYSNRK